ncbi:MAG: hypothetical protein ACTSPD_05140 [Promethearchaeota archaeon]
MRIRKRKNLKKKNCIITFLFLLPLIGISIYAGIVFYILYDLNSFTFELDPPNTKYFYDLEDIDMDRLEEMAHIFDYRNLKYNSPAGISVGVKFYNKSYNYKAINYWHETDNGAEAVAYSIAPVCYRYKVALDNGDEEGVDNATKELEFYVKTLGNMIAAPNGGLGINPETGNYYPGILSRFACTYRDAVRYHPFMLEDHPRHHNGTGKYHNWRVRLQTSRDEVSAYYLAWASVLKYIDPDVNEGSKWCVDQVKLMVEQVLHNWKVETNWLVLDYDGTPTGSDINPADWQLVALRIGATVNPKKYKGLYNYAAAKKLQMMDASMGDWMNAGFEYYGLGLGAQNMHVLILLEDNPNLRYHYIKNYEQGFYQIVKYHRQLYFNMLHLIFMDMLTEKQRKRFEDPRYSNEEIRWDVLDQLWRFHTSNWCPMRNYNLTDRPHSTRSTSLNPEIRKKELDPRREKWLTLFHKFPKWGLFAWMEDAFDINKKIYLVPRTVSEYWSGPMIWQNNPLENEGGDPHGDGLTEHPGTSYTLVYWLGRVFNIF